MVRRVRPPSSALCLSIDKPISLYHLASTLGRFNCAVLAVVTRQPPNTVLVAFVATPTVGSPTIYKPFLQQRNGNDVSLTTDCRSVSSVVISNYYHYYWLRKCLSYDRLKIVALLVLRTEIVAPQRVEMSDKHKFGGKGSGNGICS